MASAVGAQPLDPDLALAIHTSSPELAMALAPFPWSGDTPVSVVCKATGKGLANVLHQELLTLLPASQWGRLAALAVATGPGGFTGTRLGVVLARTMAQNLHVPLFGCGSFVLMARRLAQQLLREHPEGCAVQLEQTLRKRGWIRGRYRITARGGVQECQAPQLLTTPAPAEEFPWLHRPAVVEPATDVVELLRVLTERHALGDPGRWQGVLPLYPATAAERPQET
ncbi:MAG: tRNA (adenosine(37)-N6)-threonylcarbamoyltransferase complex dimerization subunit type 1 TsaB [Synechococcus sp. SB0668_bin_15]|nr:tRNA (adenosine(37)-N6)-threonylcarbamoyltransferase complex dimerization subunit type 1 TsaB [Synechococcus sp. SB0668_bin_15]MXZ82664.1 tRNA (adenosine(37)-N6)-threonylcarbamoyltransferase complex dimerization subunit type 1 TsaB [Synechococcus sp. SB0666_bin_14]MYA90989.1 tRNA (adenosine(37)-N6)-threonylcarbamoyltransferase complex dimerization subunit type 1 TsaB [Synechococcus sp. SB0663_bin_10]MYC48969.1 tRNA (adenosine(37)-N6)-threonylcarbamoyltransferase complex dimerization subunit t